MTSARATGARPPPWILRYLIVALTIVWGIVGGLLWLAGFGTAVGWGFAGYAIANAGGAAVRMAQQLREKRFGIDILAIIAIVATVVVGEVIASMIIVLMMAIGKALEGFAQGRAARELSALLDREPQTAHRLVSGSSRVDDVLVGEVAVGDLILIRAGEVVPVDGRLTSVSAAFDESSLTGESLPRTRGEGDSILSGSVNGNASAIIVATAIAQDS